MHATAVAALLLPVQGYKMCWPKDIKKPVKEGLSPRASLNTLTGWRITSTLNFTATQRSRGAGSSSTSLQISDLPVQRPDNRVHGLWTAPVLRSQQLCSLRSSKKDGYLTGALITDGVNLPFKYFLMVLPIEQTSPVPHILSPQVAFVSCLCVFSSTENSLWHLYRDSKGLSGLPLLQPHTSLGLGSANNPLSP